MKLKKIVYINLDQRKDRKRIMEENLSKLNVPYERFSAITPEWKDISPGGIYHNLYLKCTDRLKMETQQVTGRIGCWLSHKTIIDQNAGLTDPVLIIEDDIKFNQGTLNRFLSRVEILPADWDVFRVCWKNLPKGQGDFLTQNVKRKNIFKMEDFMFKVCSERKIQGGSHFVLCRNFQKLSHILDREPLIEADTAYSSRGMNSYLTRLINLEELKLGSDIT